jgi:hypothetical protein
MASWQNVARQAAQRHGVDPSIFVAQIRQESNGRDVTSPAGAQGPAQFMPSTGRGYGLNGTTIHQLGPSLDAAARLMADNLRKYGNYKRALSAYNSGRPDAYQDPNFAHGQTYNYVRSIMGAAGNRTAAPTTAANRTPSPAAPTPTVTGGGTTTTRTTTTPGVDNSQLRRSLIAEFLGSGGVKSTQATQSLAAGWLSAQDVPGTSSTATSTTPGRTAAPAAPAPAVTGSGRGAGATSASRAAARADAIDAQRLPYLWGGGHQGKTSIHAAVPLDCSGAVSKVLGINPRVSGQFTTWGKAGDGGNRGITIYANSHHVLMKIDGHFFGTSRTNPGGGAGWIPQGAISPGYLQGFTARHA